MHFKYDQNLELHNGIHAAIRGKLLEATFAPVWVEPLESAVLGYGHGGEGATSAQTFALSGVSGPKYKRPKIVHKHGTMMLPLSNVYQQLCTLYDQCKRFIGKVRHVSAMYQASRSGDMFSITDEARQHVFADVSEFIHIKKEIKRLEELTASYKPMIVSIDEDQRGLWDRVKKMVESIQKMNVFDGTKHDVVDGFVHHVGVYSFLQASSSHIDFHNFMSRLLGRVLIEAYRTTSPSFMNGKYITDPKRFSVPKWRARISYVFGILAALKWGQCHYEYDASNVSILGGEEIDFALLQDELLEFTASDRCETWEEHDFARVALCMMPVFTVQSTLHDIQFNGSSVGNNDYFIRDFVQGIGKCVFERDFSQKTLRIASITLKGTDQLESRYPMFLVGLSKLRDFVFSTYSKTASTGMNHMVGVYIGSMFSALAAYRSFNAGFQNTDYYPSLQSPLDVFRVSTETAHRVSRIRLLAVSTLMMKSGCIVGSLFDLTELSQKDIWAKMILSLYLVYIHILTEMKSVTKRKRACADKKETKEMLETLIDHNYDIRGMAILAKDFVQKYSTANFSSDNERTSFLENHYSEYIDMADTDQYMKNKFKAILWKCIHLNDCLTGGEEFGTGLKAGSLIWAGLYQSFLENTESMKDEVYNELAQALFCLDAPHQLQERFHPLPENSTTTTQSQLEQDQPSLQCEAGIPSSQPGLSTIPEGDADCSPKRDSAEAQEPVLLGSILLQTSEQRMEEAFGRAENAGDAEGGALQEAEAALSEVSSGREEHASTVATSSSAKGSKEKRGFKKVTAKLL
jgi:hypothetical protein